MIGRVNGGFQISFIFLIYKVSVILQFWGYGRDLVLLGRFEICRCGDCYRSIYYFFCLFRVEIKVLQKMIVEYFELKEMLLLVVVVSLGGYIQ